MNIVRPADLITIGEARELLGVSAGKMTQLIRDKDLPHFLSTLDRRVKLVSRKTVMDFRAAQGLERAA